MHERLDSGLPKLYLHSFPHTLRLVSKEAQLVARHRDRDRFHSVSRGIFEKRKMNAQIAQKEIDSRTKRERGETLLVLDVISDIYSLRILDVVFSRHCTLLHDKDVGFNFVAAGGY